MGYPTKFDWARVKLGDGGAPETFTVICGITGVTISPAAQTSDQYDEDCAQPGLTPLRRVKTTGKSFDITGTGSDNADEVQNILDVIGLKKNYTIEAGRKDGTSAGELLGTFSVAAVMTGAPLNIGAEGSQEITLAVDGDLTWVAA